MKEDTRKKISEKIKLAHAEGRHPGWAHKNQDLTRSTYPERWFRKVLAEDERFIGLVTVEQLRCGKYFLDFAFIEFMVDLEIDGRLHRIEEQRQKDIVRDEFLNSKGWHVYRIDWDYLCANTQQCLNDFRSYLLSKDKDLKAFVRSTQKPIIISGEQKLRDIADARMKILLEANIDFNKYGWVQRSADILGMKPQVFGRWIKRYFPDFLETCYRRQS